MRNPALWLRLAAVLLFLHATGHTLGGVIFYEANSPAEATVIQAMRASEIQVQGVTRSLWDFYYGWGLAVGALLYVVAAFTWVLGNLARRAAPGLDALFALLAASSLVQAVLCLRYIFALPTVLAAAAAVATIVAWIFHRQQRT